jgi:hypothetical protein
VFGIAARLDPACLAGPPRCILSRTECTACLRTGVHTFCRGGEMADAGDLKDTDGPGSKRLIRISPRYPALHLTPENPT